MRAETKVSWPAVATEMCAWIVSDEFASRRARLNARGKYASAIPAEIAQAQLQIPADLLAELEFATNQLVRFDALQGLRAPLASILLRSESASSSEVENLTASAKQVALAELGLNTSKNASLIADNARAMSAAVSLEGKLDVESLSLMHSALLTRSRPDIAGKLRDRPVWIGSTSPHNAEFVGPQPERVSKSLEDLESFLRRTDIPRLAQIAIAHAQFETIHPFEDGNGRTGRALVQVLLRAYGLATQSTIPLSAGLLSNTRGYFHALQTYRAGDAGPIIECFITSATKAVDLGTILVDRIEVLVASYLERCSGRSGSVQRRLIPFLSQYPALDSNLVRELLQVSMPAAISGLTALEQQGVLIQVTAGRRNRVWIATEVIAALEDFSSKARRR